MRILSRYVIRQHVAPFVFALSALTAFQLLNQIARRFGDLVGKGLPWSVIVEVFALSVPFIVTTTLSMAVLIAVLYTVGRLAAEHELTAMRASGVSLGQLMVPLLSAGLVVTMLAFVFSDQVLPRTNHRLRTLLADISRVKPTFGLKEQVINEVQRGRLFLRAARIDQSTFALREVTIYDLADQQRKRIVRADSGYMALTPDQEDLYLTLFDGTVQEIDRTDHKVFQQIEFRRNRIRVEDVGNVLSRTERDEYKGDREMGVCEMENVIRNAEREREMNARQLFTVRMNGLRGLLGLPPIRADTTLPPRSLSLYCRALARVAAFLLPAELRAQDERRPRSTQATQNELLSRFNEPGRRAFTTGRVETPRLADVRGFEDRVRSAAIRSANYRVELHKKYAIAAACLVFVLVGVPMAVSFPRGGVGYVVAMSLGVFTVYYVCLIGGETLANRLLVPPFWAMWAPNVAFGLLGVLGLWRLRRAATPPELSWARLPWRRRSVS
ncbi:MAG TPA: LptF/LptG family permease [Gemmatimonadales bacterium]|nr:LptF/LptG family permease [Gemmatimonadales bacterium]